MNTNGRAKPGDSRTLQLESGVSFIAEIEYPGIQIAVFIESISYRVSDNLLLFQLRSHLVHPLR